MTTTQAVRNWIATADNVTVFTGAGVSTESGIPDYRGPTGVWTADPDAAKYVDIDYYLTDPEIRRQSWIRRRQHPAWKVKPNPAHHALANFEKHGKLHAIITQNIDGLHQTAGNSPHKIIEVHGNIFGVECLTCGTTTPMTATLERVAAGETDPSCHDCDGILKSTTIFFGEQLKPDILQAAAQAAYDSDVFIAAGTSLTVHPAAGLVELARNQGSRLVICNADPTPYDALADAIIREPLSQTLPAILT